MSLTNQSLLAIAFVSLLASCAPAHRQGLVVDPRTGLQYGSIVQRNLVVDSSQFANPSLKLRIRNISGDPAFDLDGFRNQLESAYRSEGYEISTSNDFNIHMDITVRYSGQTKTNMAAQYGFLGGAVGGVVGDRSNANSGTALGIVSGLALGAIVGSYVQEDTYIVVTDVSFAYLDRGVGKKESTIVFSSSKRESKSEDKGVRGFSERLTTGVAVYAGGRNVRQSEIAEAVRLRFIRILKDII